VFLSNDNSIIMEQTFSLPQDPTASEEGDSPTPVTEFQNVKTFIVYNKFGLLKSKIKVYMLQETDPDKLEVLSQLHDLIILIQTYFNTFDYTQMLKLLDNVTNILADTYNIQVAQLNLDQQPEPQPEEQSEEEPQPEESEEPEEQ